MGLLSSIFNRAPGTQVTDSSSTLGRADTLPSDSTTFGGQLAARGNAAIDRATEIYQKNPKLVGGLALLASAALLVAVKNRGR